MRAGAQNTQSVFEKRFGVQSTRSSLPHPAFLYASGQVAEKVFPDIEEDKLKPILFTLSFFSVGSGFEPAAGLRPGVRLNAGWKPGGSTEVLPHELSKQY
jgi:hypothetical protein